MRTLRLALAQTNPLMGDFDGNSAHIRDIANRACAQDADLVIFPELALIGYPPEDLLLKPHFLEDCDRQVKSLAKHFPDIAGVVGFAQGQGRRVYNAAALIDQQQIAAVYHKIELPNYGVFDEKRYFAAGTSPLIFTLGGIRIGLTICEDVWIQDGAVGNCLADNQVDLVLNISASPFHAGKSDLRRYILTKFCQRTRAAVAYVNLVGGQDELVFDGGSLVLDHQGKIVAAARHFEEELLVLDLELAAKPSSVDSRDLAGSPLALTRPLRPHPEKLRPALPKAMEREAEIYRALVLGTRDYVRKNRFQRTVLGLSGGIDSALTAAIAVEALGPENVVGISMPSQYSSAETRSDAQTLAENLGIEFHTVPIESIYHAYQAGLEAVFGSGRPLGLADENLQARIRGNIIMYFSNQYGWLVLTTGNKSENAVGYCTLYGDMAGGFAVIKDVPKMLVYDLAHYANREAGRGLIPQSILERVPTAELRPNQRDEDSLPPYPTLDPILKAYVEEDKAVEEIAAKGFDRDTVLKVAAMVDTSEYKRRQAPPGVKITPKAFGRDRRLPITNRYHAANRKHTGA